MNDADVPDRNARLVAVVAPNAPFPLSGSVAGHAFKPLKSGQYDRVIVLTPSYQARFRGCSIPSVEYFATPLGDIPTATDAMEQLNRSSLINLRSVHYHDAPYARGRRTPIHEVEHGVEVQLPFLQAQLGEFRLIPIVVGELLDHRRQVDDNAIEAVADVIRRVMDDRTLLVISTNLTRHGPQYGNLRHRSNVVENVAQDDMAILDRMLDKDIPGFHRVVEAQGDALEGRVVLALLLHLLPRRSTGVVLNYDNSGRITQDAINTTSYAALAFFDPGHPPNAQREVRTLRLQRHEESEQEEEPVESQLGTGDENE